MKCPFRMITKVEQYPNNPKQITTEQFGDCYEMECPFYGR